MTEQAAIDQVETSQNVPIRNRISFRLILTNIFLAVVPVALITALVLALLTNQIETDTLSDLDALAGQKAVRLEEWLDANTTTLRVVTESNIIFNNALTASNANQTIAAGVVTRYLGQIAETDPKIVSFILYDLDGRVISASDQRFIGRLVNRQPYFANSVNAPDDLHIEPPFFDISENALVLVVTDIIEDLETDEPIGVLAAYLDTDTLSDIMIDRTGLGETGETYLVSGENNYFLTPSRFAAQGFTQNRAYRSTGIDSALNGQDGESLYNDYRGVPVIGNYRYIASLDSALLTEINQSEAFEVIETVRLSVRYSVLIAMAVAASVGVWNALSISRPISDLTTTATRIASGKLEERAPRLGNNEVTVLATTFNTMADTLTHTLTDLDHKVTEIAQANDKLRVANAKVREAARLKSEFLANMSHELRTPLNAIIGFTGIMLEGFSGEMDDEARHMTSRVYENSQNLLRLINEVLDIAKIESGRLDLVRTAFDPHALARQWQSSVGILAEQKGLRFVVEVDAKLPKKLYGDPERIGQLALNLLSNAFKFTDSGTVTLNLVNIGKSWCISVRDTGIGIPAHAKEYIFDEFRQVDGSSRRAYGGTGLGLAITRKLVLMMGGTISVDSEPGKGSEFIITLPLIESLEPRESSGEVALPALP
ncbi:MAG: sensor histidine kinase [Anaerolineae bacterium]|nr:sensor histidine kinase [Anaerolineae bacterium]